MRKVECVLGYFLLMLGFVGIVASLFLFVFNFFKKRSQKRSRWMLVSGVIILFLGCMMAPPRLQ